MKLQVAAALFASAAITTGAYAQDTTAAQPAAAEVAATPVPAVLSTGTPVVQPALLTQATLPAQTEILLSLNNQVSSRDHRTGDTFPMTVVRDVAVDGHTVIP